MNLKEITLTRLFSGQYIVSTGSLHILFDKAENVEDSVHLLNKYPDGMDRLVSTLYDDIADEFWGLWESRKEQGE